MLCLLSVHQSKWPNLKNLDVGNMIFFKIDGSCCLILVVLYLRRNTLRIDQLLSPFISWKQEKSADGNWWHGWAKVTMPKMSSNSLQYLLLQEFVIETKPERHDFMLMDLSGGTLFKDAMVDSVWQCLFRSGNVSTCWLASAQTISVTFYPATQYSSMHDFKSRNHSTWMPQWVVLMSMNASIAGFNVDLLLKFHTTTWGTKHLAWNHQNRCHGSTLQTLHNRICWCRSVIKNDPKLVQSHQENER